LFHRANSEEVELRQRNRQMANIRDETTKVYCRRVRSTFK
jgi:hypothetical protein